MKLFGTKLDPCSRTTFWIPLATSCHTAIAPNHPQPHPSHPQNGFLIPSSQLGATSSCPIDGQSRYLILRDNNVAFDLL